MSKKVFIFLIVALAVGGGLIFLICHVKNGIRSAETAVPDPKNYTYLINGRKSILVNGESKETVVADGGLASTVLTWYVEDEKGIDVNGDGAEDMVVILAQNTGGSGTFYYATALISGVNGYQETNAIFFGDRITAQPTEYKDGAIVIYYLDRKPDEPMVAIPTVKTVMRLKLVDGELVKE
jgi:hypothetical protein